MDRCVEAESEAKRSDFRSFSRPQLFLKCRALMTEGGREIDTRRYKMCKATYVARASDRVTRVYPAHTGPGD